LTTRPIHHTMAVMVPKAQTISTELDARSASLVGGVVVVLGLMISLLLVTQF